MTRIASVDLDAGMLQTVIYGIAMIALGYWFGARVTGELAYQPTRWQPQPEWVGTVHSVNTVMLAVFGLGILAMLAIDYYTEVKA